MNDDYKSKLDSGLRTELDQQKSSQKEKTIQFLGKCENEITEETKEMIQNTGVKVESVIKNIFTASGTISQIIELAQMSEVSRLEKSKQVYPNN